LVYGRPHEPILLLCSLIKSSIPYGRGRRTLYVTIVAMNRNRCSGGQVRQHAKQSTIVGYLPDSEAPVESYLRPIL